MWVNRLDGLMDMWTGGCKVGTDTERLIGWAVGLVAVVLVAG